MKKISLIICIVLLVFITGCDRKNNSDSSTWIINDKPIEVSIPENAKTSFNKAIDNFTGIVLEPIALLGTQVVSGTNYMFLCKATTVTGEVKKLWEIVIVYSDLSGNNTITNVITFDYVNYLNKEVKKSKDKNLAGGYTVYSGEYANNLPQDVTDIFNKAFKNTKNYEYIPITLLATKGNEYEVLVLEDDIKNDNKNIVVYSINNKGKILKTSYFDFNKILSN